MTTAPTNDAPDLDAAARVAGEWLDAFAAGIASGEPAGLSALLTDQVYWRDILALSWDVRTLFGTTNVAEGLIGFARDRKPVRFVLETASVQVVDRPGIGPSIEALFEFETDIGLCHGHVRLRNLGGGSGDWTAWTVFTALEDIKGHEEKTANLRPTIYDRSTRWTSSAEHSAQYETNDPDTVIIGGAQTGLALAARLGALGVPALVIEKEPRIGDVWRNRYASLVLHNQVWANHLPFMPFPSTWPVYISKDQLADWLEIYASAMGIAAWTSTTLQDSHYDAAAQRWSLTLRRGDGATCIVRPRNVVLATGVFGGARRIDLPGAERYEGKLLYAAEYSGGIDVEGEAGPRRRLGRQRS